MNQHVDALGGGIVKSVSQAAMADLGTPGFRSCRASCLFRPGQAARRA